MAAYHVYTKGGQYDRPFGPRFSDITILDRQSGTVYYLEALWGGTESHIRWRRPRGPLVPVSTPSLSRLIRNNDGAALLQLVGSSPEDYNVLSL